MSNESLDFKWEQLKGSLKALQAEIDSFADLAEAVVQKEPPSVKFFSRANLGDVTVKFSDLARAVYSYKPSLDAALLKVKEVKSES